MLIKDSKITIHKFTPAIMQLRNYFHADIIITNEYYYRAVSQKKTLRALNSEKNTAPIVEMLQPISVIDMKCCLHVTDTSERGQEIIPVIVSYRTEGAREAVSYQPRYRCSQVALPDTR